MGSALFTPSKSKNELGHILKWLSELKYAVESKPFPTPKILQIILKFEGFKYAMPLDLNMGYYHILTIKQARNLCTIILP